MSEESQILPAALGLLFFTIPLFRETTAQVG